MTRTSHMYVRASCARCHRDNLGWTVGRPFVWRPSILSPSFTIFDLHQFIALLLCSSLSLPIIQIHCNSEYTVGSCQTLPGWHQPVLSLPLL